MRALLLTLAIPLCACQAIVGSYEVGETTDSAVADTATPDTSVSDTNVGDTAKPDTAIADTAVADTAMADTAGLVVKSCKQYYAEGERSNGRRQIIAPGSPGYSAGIFAWCDLGMAQGATLVATRSGTTDGNAWAGLASVPKKTDLPSPEDNNDGVLDMDWRLLGFTEVIYELGVPTSGSPRPPGGRANFRALSTTFVGAAKDALSLELMPMTGTRPDCTLDMSSTLYPECILPMGSDAAVRPPVGSLGWVFSPNGIECYWAYKGSAGTKDCRTGAVGAGRLLVK